LRQLIDAKLEKGDSLDTEATFGEESEKESGGEVIDLMEALRRSVERNSAKKTPAKKAPAAKATAKKTQKRSAANKAAG
jgi:DNA end-binding protein Ku